MSEETITAVVISPVSMNKKRIMPGTEENPVTVELEAEEFARLKKFGAVKESTTGDVAATADADQDSSGTDTGSKDASPTALVALVEAIAQLTEDDFTGSGKPKVDVLEKLIGKEINAADRDAAWEEYQAQKADADAGAEG